MSILTKILGDPNVKVLKELQDKVDEINKLEPKYQKMSEDEFKNQTSVFKSQLKDGKSLDEILPDAFACVREAAKRTLKQRHFDVQLMGGITLHRGIIAEMRTGEGKTLASTTAAYLNALEGKGVHLITVNDYLAARDSVWMGQVFYSLGISVGCIQHESAFLYDPAYQTPKEEGSEQDKERDKTGAFKIVHEFLRPVERKEAYVADITYGTNNEYGFDFLRDNMVQTKEQMVQRDLHYCIIDEIDSILIDEARTPLIISAPDTESTDQYARFAELVKKLEVDVDYNIDEKMRASTLTENGITKMEKMLGMGNIYTEGGITMVHHIEQALKAHALFKRDKDYVVKDGEVIIVDEFTGRMMQGRRYSEGLHQAIEAKEGVAVQRESKTLATITFQNYFRQYKKLSGMTGTAATEAEEFSKIYGLEVTVIPTNKPMVRDDKNDLVYKTAKGKYEALIKDIKEKQTKGQPVLIGTVAIEQNEFLSQMLNRAGIEHQVLNAKQHEKEGNIIAQAGRPSGVTVATNMAGRGVDIVLGGNPPEEGAQDIVKKAGGLHVIGTERHESRRIDNQLRGRSGRQGDAGSTRFYLSLEDELMRIFGSDRIKSMMTTLKVPEDMPIENKMITRSIESAQKKVEGHNFDIRKHLVEYDDVINKHREVVYQKRREVLEKDDIRDKVIELIEQEIEAVVSFHTASDDPKSWDIKEIYEVANSIFRVDQTLRLDLDKIKEDMSEKSKPDEVKARTKIINHLLNIAKEQYDKLEYNVNQAMQNTADFQETKVIPIRKVEKQIYLRAIDNLWVEHLDAINYLRTGIGLRGYGQRDPLVEYKKEAYKLFTELMNLIQKQVVYSIYKVGVAQQFTPGIFQRAGMQFVAPAKTMERGQGISNQGSGIRDQKVDEQQAMQQDVEKRQAKLEDSAQTHYNGQKVGRNDACPCGSGKKFKKCHGK
ncbi:preprotein translocase subunit SecA [Patescibacteria group bacterium]|nr:preprotein translocase subunit SecA [Patescibacteria group bacterium]